MGDVWPVPGGGGAASLLGTSPEQRNRSIPSESREAEASGCLKFLPLWETSVWRVPVLCCVVLCCVVLCCAVLCCAVLCCVVLC